MLLCRYHMFSMSNFCITECVTDLLTSFCHSGCLLAQLYWAFFYICVRLWTMGGRDFPHPTRPSLGPTQPPVQWVPAAFPGLKRPRRGADHQPPSSAEVKERVELYICSPFGPSWPVFGVTFIFTFTCHVKWNVCGSSFKGNGSPV